MSARKHTFECGHKGFGKYCHLCKQLETGELIETPFGYQPNPNRW